jgi:hypothetical protein
MTAATLLPIRVTLLDTWDEVRLELPADTPVSEVKRLVLAGRGAPEAYLVKYRGAELVEGVTLADAGVRPNGALIVLSRRRMPVR